MTTRAIRQEDSNSQFCVPRTKNYIQQLSYRVACISLLAFFSLLYNASYVIAEDIKLIQKAVKENGANWVAKETSVSKLSLDEKKRLLGALPPDISNIVSASSPEASGYNFPSQIDWRNYNLSFYPPGNYVSPIRNQGSCGSCWDFAAVAATESFYLISNNTPGASVDFSEQQILSCVWSKGCDVGGWPESAYAYIKSHGIADEACYTYCGWQAPCDDKCSDWQSRVYKIPGYRYSNNVIVNNIKAFLTYAPASICFSVYDDFYNYGLGVYEHVTGDLIGGHCVEAIGYDDDLQAWIGKNSWGSGWGEYGFFKIKYGDSNPYGLHQPFIAEVCNDQIDNNNDGKVDCEDFSCEGVPCYDDSQPCTRDLCKSGVCTHEYMAENELCDDGDPCTYDDRCNAQHECVGIAYQCLISGCEAKSTCNGYSGCITEPLLAGTECDIDYNKCTLRHCGESVESYAVTYAPGLFDDQYQWGLYDTYLSTDSCRQISIGFTFKYFGVPYDSVSICENGYLIFGNTENYSSPYNWAIGNAPAGMVAVCWDDVQISNDSGIFYQVFGDAPNRMLKIQWINVALPENGDSNFNNSFEVVLKENGDLIFFYPSPTNTCSATVGLRNPDGNGGIQVSYNDCNAGYETRLFQPIKSNNCAEETVTDGTPCDDNNLCTRVDSCLAGVCKGSEPVDCAALDECHIAGVCTSATGLCSTPRKQAGVACSSDGNSCTEDICSGSYVIESSSKSFIDVSSTGTALNLSGDDNVSGALPIGFHFFFYDKEYSQFWVSTNGLLLFNGPSTSFNNTSIPTALAPNAFIAPYWGDLVVHSGIGDIFYQVQGSAPYQELVVQWKGVSQSGSEINFEVILSETDRSIVIIYGSLIGANGNSATVGIESEDGLEGVQYSYNQGILYSNLSLLLHVPETPGKCIHQPKIGALCDDVNSCTKDDRCDANGNCIGTPALSVSNIAVVSSLNPSTFGDPVTFTATVSGPCGTPTGTVTFKEGATVLGTETLLSDNAALSVNSLSANSHKIMAAYSGDSTNKASSGTVTQNVKKAEAIVLLDGLSNTYDGTQKRATVMTIPAGLIVGIMYDGSDTAPTNGGCKRNCVTG